MVITPRKTPYQGLWIFILVLAAPSLILTAMFYTVISASQTQFSNELNWASAKIFGCGIGMIFHLSCWLVGAFSEDLKAVKLRVKEFFAYIFLSPKLAITGYWEDIKTLGVAFWIDFAVVALNFGIFADAVSDFLQFYIK